MRKIQERRARSKRTKSNYQKGRFRPALGAILARAQRRKRRELILAMALCLLWIAMLYALLWVVGSSTAE